MDKRMLEETYRELSRISTLDMPGKTFYAVDNLLRTIETYFKEVRHGRSEEATPEACNTDHSALPELY